MQEHTAPGMQPEREEDTIDLLELFMGLLAHWQLITATALAGAVLAALYTFFLVTPMYKATATIYVVSRNDSVLNFSDQQIEQSGCLILGTVLNQVDYDNYLGRKYYYKSYYKYSRYKKYGYYNKYYTHEHSAEKK